MDEREPADVESGDDEAEEIEPELIELSIEKPPAAHNPPPPPSLRTASGAFHLDGPDPRFMLRAKPQLVRDVMATKLFTIEPDATIQHLEQHMEAFGIHHLPVVEGKKLVGLITRSDLLHASSSFLSDHAAERDVIIHKVAAHRVMTTELITVSPNDRLEEVAVLLWETGVGCVPVVEAGDRLVGIVTTRDFLRLAYHLLNQPPA